MMSSSRLLVISAILITLTVQINAGYWICDWVNGRGWMYCSRGICNSYGKKRSVSIDDEQIGPLQNYDGIYCLNDNLCYTCQPINDEYCRITLKQTYSSGLPMDQIDKRDDEDICS